MAIGSGSEGANTALQEEFKAELSLEEAEVLVLKTLKQVMEEKVRAAVCPGAGACSGCLLCGCLELCGPVWALPCGWRPAVKLLASGAALHPEAGVHARPCHAGQSHASSWPCETCKAQLALRR